MGTSLFFEDLYNFFLSDYLNLYGFTYIRHIIFRRQFFLYKIVYIGFILITGTLHDYLSFVKIQIIWIIRGVFTINIHSKKILIYFSKNFSIMLLDSS